MFDPILNMSSFVNWDMFIWCVVVVHSVTFVLNQRTQFQSAPALEILINALNIDHKCGNLLFFLSFFNPMLLFNWCIWNFLICYRISCCSCWAHETFQKPMNKPNCALSLSQKMQLFIGFFHTRFHIVTMKPWAALYPAARGLVPHTAAGPKLSPLMNMKLDHFCLLLIRWIQSC